MEKEIIGFILSQLILYIITYLFFIKFVKNKNLVHGFEKIKDLIRGTINTGGNIDEMYTTYEWFKRIEGVEIIDIKDIEKLDKLQNISVNYIYQDRFIGEM